MTEEASEPTTPDGDVKQIAYLLGDIGASAVYKLADKGVIPKPAKGARWNIPLCTHKGAVDYRRRMNEAGRATRNDLNAEDLKQAKLRTAEMCGELGSRAAIIADLDDALIKGAMEIQRLDSLTMKQKEKVLKVLRDVKLPPRETKPDDHD